MVLNVSNLNQNFIIFSSFICMMSCARNQFYRVLRKRHSPKVAFGTEETILMNSIRPEYVCKRSIVNPTYGNKLRTFEHALSLLKLDVQKIGESICEPGKSVWGMLGIFLYFVLTVWPVGPCADKIMDTAQANSCDLRLSLFSKKMQSKNHPIRSKCT